jgi:hypothetical protein
MRTIFTALLLLCLQVSVLACPFCQSATGKQVRSGIFNDGFALNAILTLTPFPVLLALVALVYFGPARRPRCQGSRDE